MAITDLTAEAQELVGDFVERAGKTYLVIRCSNVFEEEQVTKVTPADLASLEPGDGDAPPLLTVALLGLVGTQGALPTPYTELLLERLNEGDNGLRDFLDRLNHPVLMEYYRVWAAARLVVPYERWKNAEKFGLPPRQWARLREEDAALDYLLAFAGAAEPTSRARAGVRLETIAYYAGLRWAISASALALPTPLLQGILLF